MTFLQKNLKAQFFQSNAEHEIVNKIQSSIDQNFDFIILNPAAFTHSSIAMRDALLAVKYHLLKSICQIFTLEKTLGKNHILAILPLVSLPVLDSGIFSSS